MECLSRVAWFQDRCARPGGPLVDLTVGIVAAGGNVFTALVSRLEASTKREMSLSEFSSRDGTTFSLRPARPRSVRVQAKDLAGKAYNVEVPWRQARPRLKPRHTRERSARL